MRAATARQIRMARLSSFAFDARLIAAVRDARFIAALTGAGISAESGLATFRDAQTGLWARFDPLELATPSAFARNPKLVWDWYAWRRELVATAQPNAGHLALAELERRVGDFLLITQNVDGGLSGSDAAGVHATARRHRNRNQSEHDAVDGTRRFRVDRQVGRNPACAPRRGVAALRRAMRFSQRSCRDRADVRPSAATIATPSTRARSTRESAPPTIPSA